MVENTTSILDAPATSLGVGAGLLARHLALNRRHEPDVNHFRNSLRLHPHVQLQSPSGGIENHITRQTLADVSVQFWGQFRVRHYVRVIGKFLPELFTGN